MVHEGHADGLISGLTQHYPDTVKPALQIIGKDEDVKNIAAWSPPQSHARRRG